MSKIWKVFWGLFVDDARLAVTLLVFLVVSAIVSKLGYPSLGTVFIWIGLVLALLISIEHQLQLKIRAKKTIQNK